MERTGAMTQTLRVAVVQAEVAPDLVSGHVCAAAICRRNWLRTPSAPDGSLLAGPVDEAPAILHATLDLSRVRAESMTLDVTGHSSRPDCFMFQVQAGATAREPTQ